VKFKLIDWTRKTALGEENALTICTALIHLQQKAESFALIPIVIFSEVNNYLTFDFWR